MQIDDQAAFLAFAESLNFTQAAEVLSISQPALHVKINKLGAQLGVTLYQKQGRQLSLTSQGEEFARYCRAALAEHRRLLARLRGEESHTPMTLAAGSGAYLYLLGEGIRRYRAAGTAPLNLLTADRDQCLKLLRSGQARLACTVLSVTPADIASSPLCRRPTLLVTPKDHPLARKRSVAIKDLEGLPLIVPPVGKPFRETVETFLRQHEVNWEPALEAQGWDLMMHFVDLGLGCTLVNGCCRVPKTCRSVPVRGLPTVEYSLLKLKSAGGNAEVLALEASLREGLAE